MLNKKWQKRRELILSYLLLWKKRTINNSHTNAINAKKLSIWCICLALPIVKNGQKLKRRNNLTKNDKKKYKDKYLTDKCESGQKLMTQTIMSKVARKNKTS